MKILLHRKFERQYLKLSTGQKTKFRERRDLFITNPFHPILNNHPLHGKYSGYNSISIGGDLRVVYEWIDGETAYFITIDTHSNLYS